MKMSFNRMAFVEALGLLSSVVPGRTPKPILKCVSIITGDKDARLRATDLEVGINYLIAEVQVEQAGETVVPVDRLNAIVRESADDVLAMESDADKCTITGADSQFTIYSLQPDQFPIVPDFDGQPDLKVELEVLQAGIEQCLFAAAKESTRYAINGVLWEVEGKKLTLIATDGRRLARCRVKLASVENKDMEKTKIIVPAKTMALLDRLGQTGKDMVELKIKGNQILLSCANVVVSSSLVEGNFPKYEEIIPTGYDKKITLPTEATLSAVRRAALLTSEESRGIKLMIEKDKITFSGRAPEAGDARVDMAVDYKGEPIQIGFNPHFLTDVLRVIKTTELEMELGQSDRPGLIKSGQNFLYVLMPINLS